MLKSQAITGITGENAFLILLFRQKKGLKPISPPGASAVYSKIGASLFEKNSKKFQLFVFDLVFRWIFFNRFKV